MKYCVYIIFPQKVQKFYIGQTNGIDQRLKRHHSGLEKYTSKSVSWELVWFTSKESRSDTIILKKIKESAKKNY